MPVSVNVSDHFAAQCDVIIDTAQHSCDLTRADVAHLTKSDIDTFLRKSGEWVDLDAWLAHSIEMKACGVQVYAWYDWIFGANAERNEWKEIYRNAIRPGVRANRGPSLLQPWIMGRQESVINRDYWKMHNSIATGGYTINQAGNAIGTMTGGPLTALTGGTAVIRVTNRHGIPLDPDWFREAEVIHIFTTTAGVNEVGNWRVVDSAVDTSLTYIDVLVTSENAGSDSAFFNAAVGGASAKTGLIIPGINNVSDYERWCTNLPTTIGVKMVPFWFQTNRETRCTSSEFREVFARLMTANAGFREFQAVTEAERNRQMELEHKKRMVNAFFFQKPISADQTLQNWESLTDVVTPDGQGIKLGLNNILKEKKANWIGVREQLHLCDRVIDAEGGPLNLIEFFDENYEIYRARKTGGRTVTEIIWHTNNRYRAAFHRAMIDYYDDFYKGNMRWTQDIMKLGERNKIGMIFDSYKVEFPGSIWITIMSDEFWDDWRDEHAALDQEAAGNSLIALDIGRPPNGSIYYALLAAKRVTHSSASLNELARIDSTFRCVMEYTGIEQLLYSETGTVVVECPLYSRWIENLGTAQPSAAGRTVPYTDLLV